MKLRKYFLTGILSLGMLMSANVASAATVDYSGFNINMGTVEIGQTGTIDAAHFGNVIVNKISGALPANSMITFTYDFAGDLLIGLLGTAAGYSYDEAGTSFGGLSFSMDPPGFSVSSGTEDGSSSTALAVASAQIDFGADTATVIIKNFSSGVANYLNVFAGLVNGNKDLQIAYNVSAVPVPAALPLFGAGIAALTGFGARRRKRKAQMDALAA